MLSRNRISVFATIILIAAQMLLQGCSSREEKIDRTLQNAEKLMSEGKSAEAIEILQNGTSKFEDSAELFEVLGNAYIALNRTNEAIDALNTSIELEPSRTRLWVRIGDLERSQGNNEQAATAYQNYLTAFPSDFLAWKSLTEIHQENGDRAAAIESAMVWNRVHPSSEPARILGSLFLEGGNLPQARSWYSQSAAYESGEAARDALATLIELEIGLQQFLPAETWVKKYDERYPDAGSDARVLRAKSVLKRWRDAQREIAEAAKAAEMQEKELEEKRLSSIENERLAREERERKLDEMFSPPALENEPETETAENLDPEQEAVDPNIKAPTPLANAESSPAALPPVSNEASEAIAQAESALAAGDQNTAIDSYWFALGENPDDPPSWRALASLYVDQRNYFDAEACILEARRRDPLSIETNALYLKIIAHTQEPAIVFKEATAIRSRFPNTPEILFNFAQAIEAANASPRQVADAYQVFLDNASPSTPGYQEAQNFLRSGN